MDNTSSEDEPDFDGFMAAYRQVDPETQQRILALSKRIVAEQEDTDTATPPTVMARWP